MTLRELIAGPGRKFTIAHYAMRYAFALTLVGLIVACVEPTIAPHVAEIVGAFALVVGLIAGTHQLANMGGDFAHKTPAGVKPAPRLSGAIIAPVDREGA